MMDHLRESAAEAESSATAPTLVAAPSGPSTASVVRHMPQNQADDSRSGPVKVLVVDDDPETARGLSRALTATGNEVYIAASGAEALSALQAKRI